MGLVDQLFSICCNLEQFNLASPPGADANSSSQYGASAGSATSGRSRLSHDHVCKDPEEGHIRRLCANCFQVLTLLVRKNHILGMHLADKINSLVEPLDTFWHWMSEHGLTNVTSMQRADVNVPSARLPR